MDSPFLVGVLHQALLETTFWANIDYGRKQKALNRMVTMKVHVVYSRFTPTSSISLYFTQSTYLLISTPTGNISLRRVSRNNNLSSITSLGLSHANMRSGRPNTLSSVSCHIQHTFQFYLADNINIPGYNVHTCSNSPVQFSLHCSL
jgi:hypothetical protein